MKMRNARREELPTILDWAAAEGWNPGLDDASAFYEADPKGFFVAEASGQPIAAISVVNHSDRFAFLGLYLCLPSYRGQGIGYELWRHALEYAGERVVGLDGVAAQEQNYERSGFQRLGATQRFEGPAPAFVETSAIRLAQPQDFPALVTLDRAANGFDRPQFLNPWLTGHDTRKTIILDSPDGILGFATARICQSGCKIGPIIAPDAGRALALVAGAAANLGASWLIVDPPEAQAAFIRKLASAGFSMTFSTARMYRGDPPFGNDQLFGIATMELG